MTTRKRITVGFIVLTMGLLVVVGPTTATAGGSGFFSVHCGFSHALPDDPIAVRSMAGAAHLHEFFGSKTTNANSTYESMIASSTSCQLTPDTAGYWAPALLTPDGQEVDAIRLTAYYRALPSGETFTAFPADLRMIAGYPTVETGTDKRLGFNCSDSEPLSPAPVDCTGQGKPFLKEHIFFPSCWDGVNLDSPDHRSHMSYPEGGNCPGAFPVALPRLSVHITYPVTNGKGYGLSSDAPEGVADGRSLHADFWNTWSQDVLDALVQACLNTDRQCGEVNDGNIGSIVGGQPSASPSPTPSPSASPSPTPSPSASPSPTPSPTATPTPTTSPAPTASPSSSP